MWLKIITSAVHLMLWVGTSHFNFLFFLKKHTYFIVHCMLNEKPWKTLKSPKKSSTHNSINKRWPILIFIFQWMFWWGVYMHKYTHMCMHAGAHTRHSSANLSENIIFKIKGMLTIIEIKNLIKKLRVGPATYFSQNINWPRSSTQYQFDKLWIKMFVE